MSVENFRGIRSLDLHLDDMTVLIAENNHGKTSVFDVLGLCLGERGVDPETLLRVEDFYRGRDGTIGDVRIVLTFEDEDGGKTHIQFSAVHTDRRLRRAFVDAEGVAVHPPPPAGSRSSSPGVVAPAAPDPPPSLRPAAAGYAGHGHVG